MKKTKQDLRQQRKNRWRSHISGTKKKPRVSVFRSLRDIQVQIIDDERGHTLLAVSSGQLAGDRKGSKKAQAIEVGRQAADKAKELGIDKVVFDRGGFRYHGRVKAVAESMREAGLKF